MKGTRSFRRTCESQAPIITLAFCWLETFYELSKTFGTTFIKLMPLLLEHIRLSLSLKRGRRTNVLQLLGTGLLNFTDNHILLGQLAHLSHSTCRNKHVASQERPSLICALLWSWMHGADLCVGSTPRSPDPASLHLMALQLKPSLPSLSAPEYHFHWNNLRHSCARTMGMVVVCVMPNEIRLFTFGGPSTIGSMFRR